MRRVRDRDTAPELAFRRALYARGLRYRVHASDLPGKPDVVFARKRLAIFVDGDFWHGGQWETRGLRRLEQQFARTESRDYWLRKIRRTMQRDAAATARLQALGWTVLRFWESDIRNALDACVEMTVGALHAPAHDRHYTPLAEKSVALRSASAAVWEQGLEQEGWRVVRPATQTADDTAAVTLVVGAPGAEVRAPLAALDFAPDALLDGAGGALSRALFTLTERGYLVDAFMAAWNGGDAEGARRLFVVGTLAAARRGATLRERRGAYITAGEPGDARPPEVAEFIRGHPELAWRLRALPPLPSDSDGSAATAAWIASMYLNPVVNELLRGQPLYPDA